MKFFRVLNHIFGTFFLGKKINALNKNRRMLTIALGALVKVLK